MKKVLIFLLLSVWSMSIFAQNNLISNTGGRKSLSLNGKWQYIVDPYESGFYDTGIRG
jgi:beta-glucuronidase